MINEKTIKPVMQINYYLEIRLTSDTTMNRETEHQLAKTNRITQYMEQQIAHTKSKN